MSQVTDIITYEFRIYSPGSIINYLKIIFAPNEDYNGGDLNSGVSSEDVRQAVFSSLNIGQTEEQEFNQDFRNSFKLMLIDSGPYMTAFGPVSSVVSKIYESEFNPVDIHNSENMLSGKVYKIDYNEPKTLQQLKDALLIGDIFGQGSESSEGYNQSSFPWFLDVSITGDPTVLAPYKDDEISLGEALIGVETHHPAIYIASHSSGADEIMEETLATTLTSEEAEILTASSWDYKDPDHCLTEIEDVLDPDAQPSLFVELQPEVCDTSLDPDPEDVILSMGEYMRVCPTCIPNDSFSSSWRHHTMETVWLDEYTCEYVIQFHFSTNDLSWNELKLPENLEAAKGYKNRAIYLGLEKILAERGKVVSNETILANPSEYQDVTQLGIDIDYGDPDDPILNSVVKRSIDSGQNDGTTVSIYGLDPAVFDIAKIENPMALQLYSKCSMEKGIQGSASDYLEQPDWRPFHVVRVPAALIGSIPDDPFIHASEENSEAQSVEPTAQEGVSETIIKGIDARQILKNDFAKLFKTFGEYQAHFLHIQNGRVRINYPEDEDGNIDEASMPFYLGKYEFKFEDFYTDFKELLDKNGFRLTRKDSGYKHAYEIKIVVENEPGKKYVIKKVFARYFNCPYKRLTRGVGNFIDSWKNEQTLISYVIKQKKELTYIGKEVPPWQNFISEFTYPEIFYNYGNPSQGLDASSCLVNTTSDSSDDEALLEDLLLSSALSFSSALEYSMNTLNCRKISEYDITEYQELFEQFNPSNNPEVMKLLTDYKKYGQALTTQYNEARPYLAKKSKTAFKKMLRDKKNPEKMFFERLMGEPIGQFVKNAAKDPGEKISKLMSKINPCNWEKILLDLIRCMMKGLNANTVLRKTAASLMGNLSPIDFQRVFVGLPSDIQVEVKNEVWDTIKGLDYFKNYTEFDVDTYITLSEQQEQGAETKQQYEQERSPVTPPPDPAQADPSALQDIEESRDDYETTTDELEELLSKQERGLIAKIEYDRLQIIIDQTGGLITQWEGIRDSYSNETISQTTGLGEDDGSEDFAPDTIDYPDPDYDPDAAASAQAQIDNFILVLADLSVEQESTWQDAGFEETDFSNQEEYDSAMTELTTDIGTKQQEKNTAAFAVLNELTKNASPNQYEKAVRKILETVGKAYIDLIINKLSIDQLKELVDSLPGAEIFLPIFKAQLCPHSELLETWQKAAWASLDINPCKNSNWQLPPIPNISGFKFLDILEIMLQEFIKELTKRIMAALLAYFMKALQIIVQKICDLLAGIGGALLNGGQDGMSNGNLFDAIADSFCGDFNGDVYNGAGQFGPAGAYQSTGAQTLSDSWEMYTGKQIPLDVIVDWGTSISEVVTLDGWKELFVTGADSSGTAVADAWLITQGFPEITGYIRSEDELSAFFNLLSDHLTTPERNNIEQTINGFGSYWDVGNDTICKIFCGDLTYGTEEFPAEFAYDVNTPRFSRDFEGLLNNFIKGPNDDYSEVFREISDPFGNDGYCEDVMDLFQDDANAISGKKPLIGKEPEAIKELKEEIADSTFQILEISYYNDLISSKESFFNNILADRGNKKLTRGELFDPSHEFRTKFNLLWPNANNSTREHKDKWIGAGFLLKLFMRISHNRRMDEIETAQDEDIENLVDAPPETGDGWLAKTVKKLKKFVKKKINKILSGPIRKFFAIFKIDYPEPSNILPKTVGLSFKESLANTDGTFVEDIQENHTYSSGDTYSVDLSLIGLGQVQMYKPAVRHALNKPFPKTPDIEVKTKLGKAYESITGYSQNQLYKRNQHTLNDQYIFYKWYKNLEEQNGPRYVISCYEVFYGKAPDSDIEGYIENIDTGEQIATDIEGPNNKKKQSTAENGNRVLNNVISVPIDTSRYQDLYHSYFDEKSPYNSQSPQEWAFQKHIEHELIRKLQEEYVSVSNISDHVWRLPAHNSNNYSSENKWQGYYSTGASFYDRVCQDIINKMTAGLLRAGEELEAVELTSNISTEQQERSHSNAFKFGYDHEQQIKFNDLLYVNPEATTHPSSWYYDKEEEDQKLGKSATGNERVVFLNPDIYGGSYKRPKIYVKPASYGGIYGLFQYYVPEPDGCAPKNEIKLFIKEIKDQILQLEKNLTRDERMSQDVECANEPPFDLIADNSSHAYIHGTVRLTIRTYILEFLLRCMPVIEQIRLTPENFDDSMSAFLIDNIRKGAKQTPENFSFRKFSRDEYWYLLLEQMVQTTEREILAGELSPDGTLTAMLETISGVRDSYKQPDREDLKFLRLIETVGRRRFFKDESVETNISIGGTIQSVNFKDRFPKEWEDVSATQRNRLIFMIDALAFHALGPLFKSKLSGFSVSSSNTSLKNTKFNGYTFSLKTLRRACKIYKIHQNEQMAINISSYLIRKELERYLKTYRIDTTSREGGPSVFNVSKFALNPQSGLAWGPPIKVGTYEVEKVLGGVSNQQYGDVHDLHENVSSDYEYDARDMYSIMSIIENTNIFAGESDNLHVDPNLKDRPVSFFYVEKYVKTFLKTGDLVSKEMSDVFEDWTGRPMSIATFQEKIKSLTDMTINFEDTASISDYFGDATLNVDGEGYSGSIGIKFGVRLSYCRSDLEMNTAAFQGNSIGSRKFVNIDGDETEYYPLPLLEFEQDVLDISMGEYMYQKVPKQNAGEILKCYIDRMCEMKEYSFLMEYLFPVKRCSSIILFNSYYSYINSIGEHPSERDNHIEPADNEWKGKILQRTKERLRTMFSRYYKARDFNKEKGDKRSLSVEWLKFNIPAINSNIDFSSIPWWQRMRFHGRPWNKYDEACIDGAMGAFNQNTPQQMIQPESEEGAYTHSWSPPIYDGQYTTYEPPPCPEECVDQNGNTIECPEETSDTMGIYTEVVNLMTQQGDSIPECEEGQIFNEETGRCEDFNPDTDIPEVTI